MLSMRNKMKQLLGAALCIAIALLVRFWCKSGSSSSGDNCKTLVSNEKTTFQTENVNLQINPTPLALHFYK